MDRAGALKYASPHILHIVRRLKIYSSCDSHIYNILLLTMLTMSYSRALELIPPT